MNDLHKTQCDLMDLGYQNFAHTSCPNGCTLTVLDVEKLPTGGIKFIPVKTITFDRYGNFLGRELI